MNNNIAIFQNFNVNSQHDVLAAYRTLKQQLGVKSVDKIGPRIQNIFSNAILSGAINKDQTQTICKALDKVARNIDVIQASERGFFSKIFSWLPFTNPDPKSAIRAIYQTEVEIKNKVAQAEFQAREAAIRERRALEKQSFDDAVGLLPVEFRDNISRLALKNANNDYVAAKVTVLKEVEARFSDKVEKFAADFKAGKTQDKFAKELYDRPQFLSDARSIYSAFNRGKNEYEKMNNFFDALLKVANKENEDKRGGDYTPELVAGCFVAWGAAQNKNFIEAYGKIDLSVIEQARDAQERDDSQGGKRAMMFVTIRQVIDMIYNHTKPNVSPIRKA